MCSCRTVPYHLNPDNCLDITQCVHGKYILPIELREATPAVQMAYVKLLEKHEKLSHELQRQTDAYLYVSGEKLRLMEVLRERQTPLSGE